MRRYFYRLLLLAVILITLLTISFWTSIDHYAAARRCFRNADNNATAQATPFVQRLPDIMTSTRRPTPGRSVFFHETSCLPADGIARLNARQACAIESAALSSSDWDVFVLFASPVGDVLDNRGNSSRTSDDAAVSTSVRLMEALRTYGNVHMRTVDLWSYAENTPLDGWMRSEALFQSQYLNSHASDLLRYLRYERD